jgi:hypothetical protein
VIACSAGTFGVHGAQRRVAVVGDHELEREAVRVGEAQRALAALGARQTPGPEVQRGVRGHAELQHVDHPDAGAAAGGAGELEPREDRAGRAGLVAEVQVVGVGRVEVDGLLDQPQAERVRVEVDVGLGVARDHRDVVEPFELHRFLFRIELLSV